MIEFFVTTFNRKKITERCFENIKKLKFIDQVHLSINDDGSTEYDKDFLLKYSKDVTVTPNLGINEIMLRKLVEFKHSKKFSYFYSTDNDILHDPDAILQ
jgi:GT2 family glycosyltransferase